MKWDVEKILENLTWFWNWRQTLIHFKKIDQTGQKIQSSLFSWSYSMMKDIYIYDTNGLNILIILVENHANKIYIQMLIHMPHQKYFKFLFTVDDGHLICNSFCLSFIFMAFHHRIWWWNRIFSLFALLQNHFEVYAYFDLNMPMALLIWKHSRIYIIYFSFKCL